MADLKSIYTIKLLSSGYWSVWFGDEWFCAACKTKEDAEMIRDDLIAELEKGEAE